MTRTVGGPIAVLIRSLGSRLRSRDAFACAIGPSGWKHHAADPAALWRSCRPIRRVPDARRCTFAADGRARQTGDLPCVSAAFPEGVRLVLNVSAQSLVSPQLSFKFT